MSEEVKMPQMGESIAEGTIVRWLKKVGDSVKRDEPLFEISTDKVDAEIPAPASGVLSEIKVNEGETVAVNTVVAVINGAGAQPAATEAPAEAAAQPAEQPAQAAPTGTQPTDQVTKEALAPDSPPAEVTEQPAAQSAAPAAPAAGESVAGESAAGESAAGDSGEDLRRTRSSPLVRKIAKEHGIDISQIEGTGISGRVTKNDILSFIENRGVAEKAATEKAATEKAGAQPAQPQPQPRRRPARLSRFARPRPQRRRSGRRLLPKATATR